MVALAVIGSLVSGVVGAVGAMASASAQADAAEYQAAVDERNKRMIQQQTTVEMDDQRRENRRKLATIRAAYGSSGLALEGSPLDVLEDSAIEGELEVGRIQQQGQTKAMGYSESATLSRMRADAARTAGPINAVSSLIGGATNAGRSLMRMG